MKKFFKDESGQGMVEYGLIIALIAIVAIGGLTVLGPKVEQLFKDASGSLGAGGGGNGGGGGTT